MPNETENYAAALPAEGSDAFDMGWWLTGGVSLLLWTAIAVLLTSA